MGIARSKFFMTLISCWLISGNAFAKDAFGLDSFKTPVEDLTKPKKPYITKFGNSINVYTLVNSNQVSTSQKSQVRFLIQGGLHGNELLASEFVAWLAKRFARGESLLNTLNGGHVSIDFVPYANPDGTIQYTRYNGNGVNLNRNFDVLWGITRENPGPQAFSESESRAIRDLVFLRDYTAAVDVHGFVNWIVLPTSPKEPLKGLPKISAARQGKYDKWAKAVKSHTSRQLPGYEIKTAGELRDGGAFEDFAWWSAGVPAVCLELFTDSRHVLMSFASTIMNILTPKNFDNQKNIASSNSDTFEAYESYIHSLFQEAIHIRLDSETKREIVSTK